MASRDGDTLTKKVASRDGDALTKQVASRDGYTLTRKVASRDSDTLTRKVASRDSDTLTKKVASEHFDCDALNLEVLSLASEDKLPKQGYLSHYEELCSWLPGRQRQVELLLTIFGEVHIMHSTHLTILSMQCELSTMTSNFLCMWGGGGGGGGGGIPCSTKIVVGKKLPRQLANILEYLNQHL